MQTCQHTVGVINDTFDASQYGLYRVDTALSTALHDCHHQQQAALCQLSSSHLLDKLLSSDVSCGPINCSQGCFQRHQSAALASAALQVRDHTAPGTCSVSGAQHKSLASSHVPLHAAGSGGFAKRPGPAVLRPSHSFDADAFAAATEAAEAVAAAAAAAATTSASPTPLLLSLTGSGTPTLGVIPTAQFLISRGSSSSSWGRITPSGELPGGEDAAATLAAGQGASSCSEPPAAVAPQLPWTTEQRLKPAPNPASHWNAHLRVVEETAEWHCPEAGNSSGPESAVGALSAPLQVATEPPAARPSAQQLQTTQPEPPTRSLFTALEAVGVSAAGFPPAMLEMQPELDILELSASILDIPDQQQQLQWSNSLTPSRMSSGLYQETGGKAVRAATHVSAAAPKQRWQQQRGECLFTTGTTAAAARLTPAVSAENTASVLSMPVNCQPAWAHPLPNKKNHSGILLTPGGGHDATAGSTAGVAAVAIGQHPEYALNTFTPGPDGKLLQAEPDAGLKPLAVGPSMQKPVSNSTSRKRLSELSSSPSICHRASNRQCKCRDNDKDRGKAEKERDKQKKSQEQVQVQVLEQQLAEAVATKAAMRGHLDAMIRDKASLLAKVADFTSHLQEVVAENAALSSHNAVLQQLLAAVSVGGRGGTGLDAAGNATAGSFSHGHATHQQGSLQNPSRGAVQALHVGQQQLSQLDPALLLPLVGAPNAPRHGRPADAVTATVAAGGRREEFGLPGTSCHQVVSALNQRQLPLQQQPYDLAARHHRRRFALL